MKIAIIGAGNMGGATALGFAKFVPEAELTVTAAHAATLGKFAVRGIATTLDNVEAATGADIIILGVKPWLVDEVLTQIRPASLPPRSRSGWKAAASRPPIPSSRTWPSKSARA